MPNPEQVGQNTHRINLILENWHSKVNLGCYQGRPRRSDLVTMAANASPNEVMMRVRRELQEQQMEELVQAMTDKCFEKCVKKPGTSLTTGEQNCIAKAMDRYLEAMALVFNTVAKKAQT